MNTCRDCQRLRLNLTVLLRKGRGFSSGSSQRVVMRFVRAAPPCR